MGFWMVDVIFDVIVVVCDDVENVVCFCCGWFLGDGIGVGKGW